MSMTRRLTMAGLTETSPMTHILPLASARGRQSSIGKLVPTVSARLIDTETGQDIPANSGLPGELWMKGPNVMKGYFKNPDATRNTFDETGEWFKSGDQARRDEEGYYYIEDRLKEVRVKGFTPVR
jgi:long-subunit acyl-CoA synthetase (AMP-forming)